MGYVCSKCGVAYSPPRNCVHCDGRGTMKDEVLEKNRRIKALEASLGKLIVLCKRYHLFEVSRREASEVLRGEGSLNEKSLNHKKEETTS